MSIRPIKHVRQSQPALEGAGVKLHRAFGFHGANEFGPFLLLDDFRNEDPNDYQKGFPWHPHRGIETITYVLAGSIAHGDSLGNRGMLNNGDVQWMTAGRGIVHSEMPEQKEGLLWGFQLWVNLSADSKMTEPCYQEIRSEDIPEVTRDDGAHIRVIAGELEGVIGAVNGIAVDPTYLDVFLPAGAVFSHLVPNGHAVFTYVFEGNAVIGARAGARTVDCGQLAVLGVGEEIRVSAQSNPARFLLAAGRPHREPIVKYGPFVMNTRQQIAEAIDDFRSGRF